jgi:hypothetical protein
MVRWVGDIGPCNCSRRYWGESTREIVEFKGREKEVNKFLAVHEKKGVRM